MCRRKLPRRSVLLQRVLRCSRTLHRLRPKFLKSTPVWKMIPNRERNPPGGHLLNVAGNVPTARGNSDLLPTVATAPLHRVVLDRLQTAETVLFHRAVPDPHPTVVIVLFHRAVSDHPQTVVTARSNRVPDLPPIAGIVLSNPVPVRHPIGPLGRVPDLRPTGETARFRLDVQDRPLAIVHISRVPVRPQEELVRVSSVPRTRAAVRAKTIHRAGLNAILNCGN